MDDERFALYMFGLSFLASVIYAFFVDLGGFSGIIGVFMLFGLIVFIFFSDEVTKLIVK